MIEGKQVSLFHKIKGTTAIGNLCESRSQLFCHVAQDLLIVLEVICSRSERISDTHLTLEAIK